MLVLTRKVDEWIDVSPRPDFAPRLLKVLAPHLKTIKGVQLVELQQAIQAAIDDPFFQQRIHTIDVFRDRRQVRIGIEADPAWQIMRNEVPIDV